MRLLIVIILVLMPYCAHAIQAPPAQQFLKPYKGLSWLFLSSKEIAHPIKASRPNTTNTTAILQHDPVLKVTETQNGIIICHDVQPYDHQSWVKQAGRTTRITANNAEKSIENIIVQPRYSGLRGPSLSLIRNDIERTMRDNTGSSAEIFHNTKQTYTPKTTCPNRFSFDYDIEIKGQADFFESDKAPLYRTYSVINTQVHMGRNFMGSLGIRVPFKNNLHKETDDLIRFDRGDPIGADVIGFAEQPINIEHATLNGFFTPSDDLYVGAQAGYIDERFIGFGGELLYRPNDNPWAVGFDLWGTARRSSFEGNGFTWDPKNKHLSAFVNGYYDFQTKPFNIGLSFGRFIDGDYGGELTAAYKPKAGWRIEGFTRYSNETNRTLDNATTNMDMGLRLTIPLEQLRGVPLNSRASFEIAPIGRDKRQRVDNQYPLYTLTDPWSSANIYQHWDKIIE